MYERGSINSTIVTQLRYAPSPFEPNCVEVQTAKVELRKKNGWKPLPLTVSSA